MSTIMRSQLILHPVLATIIHPNRTPKATTSTYSGMPTMTLRTRTCILSTLSSTTTLMVTINLAQTLHMLPPICILLKQVWRCNPQYLRKILKSKHLIRSPQVQKWKKPLKTMATNEEVRIIHLLRCCLSHNKFRQRFLQNQVSLFYLKKKKCLLIS